REIDVLSGAGFKLVAQQWTALRQEQGRISALRFVDGVYPPREFCRTFTDRAIVNCVLLIARGRRAAASARVLSPNEALAAIRNHWPMLQLHPQREYDLVGSLATSCRIIRCEFSRCPSEVHGILRVLTSIAGERVEV